MASSFSSAQPWLSRSFRPTRSLAASTCFFHPHHFHNHPLPRPSRSFRPTRSLAASWLVSTFHFSTSSPPPGLSRSFRPTRSVAASILSFTHLSYFSTFALTQSVIPAHSVSGYHGLLLHPCSTFSTLSSGNLLVSFLFDSVVLSLPSSSGLLTPVYSLYARDSVTGSPNPLIHFVSSFFSARRPVAMGIQSDLRCVATNVDPK